MTPAGSALPKHVYKILPNTSPYQGTPIPIPSSHEFPRTELDLKDGFVHLSTKAQLHNTLARFYSADAVVQLLKVDYGRMSAFKKVQWDLAGNGEYYPHLYGTLTGEEVVDLKLVANPPKSGEEKDEDGWAEGVKLLEEQGWLLE